MLVYTRGRRVGHRGGQGRVPGGGEGGGVRRVRRRGEEEVTKAIVCGGGGWGRRVVKDVYQVRRGMWERGEGAGWRSMGCVGKHRRCGCGCGCGCGRGEGAGMYVAEEKGAQGWSRTCTKWGTCGVGRV